LKTYIARIQTHTGTQTIKLKAASIDEATTVLQSQAGADGSLRYSIQEQTPLESPEFFTGMTSATGSLLACLIAFAVADYQIHKWLKR